MIITRPATLAEAFAFSPPAEALTHAQYRSTRHFGCLDGLRALSILAVVWHHAGGGQLRATGLPRGFLGVDCFFAISGFLIVTLLLRERDRHGRIDLRGFYARRSLRIFPVYYAFLFGLAGTYALLKPGDPQTGEILTSLPAAALYVTNVVVIPAGLLHLTWSLATEEQFYLVWAPVEKFLKTAGVHALLTAVVALSLAVNFGAFDRWIGSVYGFDAAGEPRLPAVFGTTLLPIALGVVLAHALHGPRGFAAVRRVAGFPGAPGVWAAAVVLVILLLPGDVRGWIRPLVQAGMVLTLAALLLRPASALNQSLRWKPLVRLGLVSYGVYLFHKPATGLAEALFGLLGLPGRGDGSEGALLLTAVAMALTWGVAELSFRFFETPFLRLKSRFAATPAGAADIR